MPQKSFSKQLVLLTKVREKDMLDDCDKDRSIRLSILLGMARTSSKQNEGNGKRDVWQLYTDDVTATISKRCGKK